MEVMRGASVFALARSGNRRALSALLSTNPRLASSVDETGVPLLHVAAELDDRLMVEVVLDCGADLTVEGPSGRTALERAASAGACGAVRVLVERGAELRCALHWAALGGRHEAVRWLLDIGADATRHDPVRDTKPAGWAREGGHEALAETLESLE